MTEQGLLQILVGLLSNQNSGGKSWQEYGGVNTKAETLVSRVRLLVISAAGHLPMGQIWGPYAADYLVGDDFSRGVLHNTLSGLMAPTTGSYAGNFQNLWNKQIISSLKSNRETIKDDLRNDFLRNYYRVTTGETDQKKLDALVNDANMLSLPSVLNFLVDPASNNKILQNIKEAQASALSWNLRQNPWEHFGLDNTPGSTSSREMALRLGMRIKDMAMQANRYALGLGDPSESSHFGGFTGAEVSLIANILSGAALQLDPDDLESSLKSFLEKVKATARALAPLKDIFGRDVKAMTDMLQSMTGQSISQLTPTMIRSLATSTVDMSRYSGATVAQMAQTGKAIMTMSANMGGTTFSRIGAGNLGGYYSALMAAGNTPAGVHAAEYAASTQHALASAQASLGVDWAAMAYGIWVLNQGKDADTSILTFMDLVSEQRRTSPDMMSAIISVAKVSSQQLLLRGRGTTLYRTALQDPRLARLGIELQYREHLLDTVFGLAQNNPDIPYAQYLDFLSYMKDADNASLIQQLVANNGDSAAIDRFVRGAKASGKTFSSHLVNLFLNSSGSLSYTARWSGQLSIKQYLAAQKEIKEQLAPLEAFNGGGNFTLFHALASAKNLQELGGKVTLDYLGKKISLSSVAFGVMARGVLGTDNIALIQARVKNLKDTFGETRAADMLATASDKVKSDPGYVLNIRALAELGTYDSIKGDKDKEQQWLNAFLHVTLTEAGLSAKELKSLAAKSFKQKAIAKFRDSKLKNRLEATGRLKTLLQHAARILRALQMTANTFSGDLATQKEKLAAFKLLMKTSLGMLTEREFNKKSDKEKGGLTWEEYKQAYKETSAGYDLREDALRTMKTVAELLLRWLRKHAD